MKKALGLFFFIHLVWSQSSVVCAAQWPPLDAKWYYTNSYLQTNTISYSTVETVKDTIVGTSACRVIAERFGGYRQDVSYIVKRNNDSIFLYNADKSFSLLYNFAAQKGESYTTGYLKADGKPLVVYVDSVKQIVLNGKSKRVQYVHSGDGFTIDFGGVVIEDIGNTTSFFPQLEMGHYGPLRCYSDAAMGNVKNPFYPANESKWNRVDCDQVVQGTTSTQYQPIFGKDSTYFSVLFGGNNLIHIQKDTIVDGQVYKILPFGNMVRITSDNSKAYLRPKTDPYNLNNQREYLVMDLNMKLGDYFILNDTISSTQYNYQSKSNDTLVVDSVYLKDGLKHIRFNRTMDYAFNWITVGYPFEFIEGVGTIIGFEYRPLIGQLYRNDSPIVCYFKDGTKFYTSEVFNRFLSKDGCFSNELMGINEKRTVNSIILAVDKPTNQLIIKSTNGAEQDYAIAVYSANGTLLKRIDEVALPAAVSLSNLTNGVYIVSIKTATSIQNRKIVINRY